MWELKMEQCSLSKTVAVSTPGVRTWLSPSSQYTLSIPYQWEWWSSCHLRLTPFLAWLLRSCCEGRPVPCRKVGFKISQQNTKGDELDLDMAKSCWFTAGPDYGQVFTVQHLFSFSLYDALVSNVLNKTAFNYLLIKFPKLLSSSELFLRTKSDQLNAASCKQDKEIKECFRTKLHIW